jgi:hypothetical protein
MRIQGNKFYYSSNKPILLAILCFNLLKDLLITFSFLIEVGDVTVLVYL